MKTRIGKVKLKEKKKRKVYFEVLKLGKSQARNE